MNTKLNGIRELTAGDLDSVSGGSDVRAAVVGYVVGKLIDEVNFVDALMKKATGTLKGIQKPPPK
jgi:hypothetical protein